ncbi:hypothetical protein HCU40_08250 [Pseudanabaena biceps]|nr:hypothetical protein [Pseudanabaena biceps]
MGFAEVSILVMVGCVTAWRLQGLVRSQKQIFGLWLVAIILPSLAIAWITLSRTDLPLAFVVVTFLFCIWYSKQSLTTNPNDSDYIHDQRLPKLTDKEAKQLKACFSPTIYQLRDLEYRDPEIYCRGNLRSRNYKYAYETINQNIQAVFGDRFTCYLQESPLENSGVSFGNLTSDQENSTQYCFYLIPNSNSTISNGSRQRWLLSIATIILTAFAILAAGAKITELEDLTLANLQGGIPYLAGLASTLIAKAIAQFYLCKKYQLPFEMPILLPSLSGFGLLSSIRTNLVLPNKSHPQQRRILFDLAVFPNLASLVVSVVLLILGNWLLVPTNSVINDPMSSPLLLPNLGSFELKNSIFVDIIHNTLQLFAPATNLSLSANIDPLAIPKLLSPLTLAGWSGLAIAALQLLPFDLLDGGNMAIGMFGHRQATQIAKIARIILLAIAFLIQPWLRIYSLLLFALPTPSPLVNNEGLEIDKYRDLLGLILMAIALLILLPSPKSLLWQ